MIVNEKRNRLNEMRDFVNKFNSFSKSEYWAIFINKSDNGFEPCCHMAFIKDGSAIFEIGFELDNADYYLSDDTLSPQNVLNEIDSVIAQNPIKNDVRKWDFAREKWNDKKNIVMCIE